MLMVGGNAQPNILTVSKLTARFVWLPPSPNAWIRNSALALLSSAEIELRSMAGKLAQVLLNVRSGVAFVKVVPFVEYSARAVVGELFPARFAPKLIWILL